MDNNYIKRSDQSQIDCVSVPWHEVEKMGIKRDDPMAVHRLLQMYDELKRSKKEQEQTKKQLQNDLDKAKNEKAKTEELHQKMLIRCGKEINELQKRNFNLHIISIITFVVLVIHSIYQIVKTF